MQDMVKEPRILETDVYGGPGSKAYAKIGYIGLTESYTKQWDEYGYQFIEYTAQNGTKKRGYIAGGSSAATYPSKFATGCRGTANGSGTVTVYWYPEANDNCYFGRLSSGETFTYLEYDSTKDMQFIEYSTGGGTKRGYIRTSDGTPQNDTILAKSKGDISTYTTPGGGKDGYLYEEEYCVILAQSKKYYSIEYNTVTGRKVAFVPKTDLTVIGSISKVPSAPNSESNTTMLKNQNVYGGPSDRIYASIGSVDANEEVTIIHVDGNYCYIQYYTSTTYKRGYVPISSVADVPNDKLEHPVTYTNGYYMKSFAATNVYSAPDSTSATLGSVYALEGVTYLGTTEGIFAFVEYSSVAGPKRGFIYAAHLFKTYENSGFGKCNADTDVYYAPGSVKIGTIYDDEYICILNQDDQRNIYYIEYNSSNGRKRGYASCDTITRFREEEALDIVVINTDDSPNQSSKVAQKVYSGPSEAYYSVGSIMQNEIVKYLGADSGMAFIQYNFAGGYKRGYVPANTLEDAIINKPVVTAGMLELGTIEGISPTLLGPSGQGYHIYCYILGNENASKQMILNFAIHGHEDFRDKQEQDGYELTKLARSLIADLAHSNLNGWCIRIIPALNPDGILYKHSENDRHVDTIYEFEDDCNGKGRHNTVDLNWDNAENIDWNQIIGQINNVNWDDLNGALQQLNLSYTETYDGIDMNRCFPFHESNGWTYNTGNDFSQIGQRNYIGNTALRAKEALYLWALINKVAVMPGVTNKVFIDTHGWTQQIISSDENIKKYFKSSFSQNELKTLEKGEGYVARYAQDLGFRSCLFEFPHPIEGISNYNFNYIEAKGFLDPYIEAIKSIINEK